MRQQYRNHSVSLNPPTSTNQVVRAEHQDQNNDLINTNHQLCLPIVLLMISLRLAKDFSYWALQALLPGLPCCRRPSQRDFISKPHQTRQYYDADEMPRRPPLKTPRVLEGVFESEGVIELARAYGSPPSSDWSEQRFCHQYRKSKFKLYASTSLQCLYSLTQHAPYMS